MSPEDFAKYQVLVAPKPKPEKTREQELADRVKSLQRLRSQEATHKGQIDKLELDVQHHRDMLQGVLFQVFGLKVRSRAQVAREQAPSDNGGAIPPTECDSLQGMTLVVKLLLRKCTIVLWKRRVGMSLCSLGT